ncbi:MAG TPA: tripartite tricarboxylate transporter substrate-binding protein [Candidatus Binatia bacterium]|nr:tripartite tricarboxylate transporter substrate-binding protein [Candidatus Binatia bacterium]
MNMLMIGVVSLLVFFAHAPAYGASSFEGKTITIVVGYKPGGGYDRYARLIAKYLPKYIPGNPGAIVQNMPGASSVIAANHIYSVAKPDGLTIGTFNNATVVAQLIKVDGVRFDLTKYAWLGSAASDAVILSVRADLPYKTAEDLRKVKQFVVGTTGPGSSTHDFPALLDEFAGFDFKLVPGYSSSADVMLALERKEVDGRAGSYDSIKPFIDRGLVRPIIRNRTSAPGIEKLPVDESLATSKQGKLIMAVNAVPTQIYRPFVAPPGTAKDALKILRDAFANCLKDKDLLAEATKGKMTIDYTSPEDALKVVSEVLGQPPDVVQELAKHIKFGE